MAEPKTRPTAAPSQGQQPVFSILPHPAVSLPYIHKCVI